MESGDGVSPDDATPDITISPPNPRRSYSARPRRTSSTAPKLSIHKQSYQEIIRDGPIRRKLSVASMDSDIGESSALTPPGSAGSERPPTAERPFTPGPSTPGKPSTPNHPSTPASRRNRLDFSAHGAFTFDASGKFVRALSGVVDRDGEQARGVVRDSSGSNLARAGSVVGRRILPDLNKLELADEAARGESDAGADVEEGQEGASYKSAAQDPHEMETDKGSDTEDDPGEAEQEENLADNVPTHKSPWERDSGEEQAPAQRALRRGSSNFEQTQTEYAPAHKQMRLEDEASSHAGLSQGASWEQEELREDEAYGQELQTWVDAAHPHELQQFIDTTNLCVFGVGETGLVNEWNNQACELTGFTREQVLGGIFVENHIGPDFRGSVKEVLGNALQGKVVSNFKFQIYSKDYRRVDMVLNFSPRKDAEGNIVGVIGVGHHNLQGRQADQGKSFRSFFMGWTANPEEHDELEESHAVSADLYERMNGQELSGRSGEEVSTSPAAAQAGDAPTHENSPKMRRSLQAVPESGGWDWEAFQENMLIKITTAEVGKGAEGEELEGYGPAGGKEESNEERTSSPPNAGDEKNDVLNEKQPEKAEAGNSPGSRDVGKGGKAQADQARQAFLKGKEEFHAWKVKYAERARLRMLDLDQRAKRLTPHASPNASRPSSAFSLARPLSAHSNGSMPGATVLQRPTSGLAYRARAHAIEAGGRRPTPNGQSGTPEDGSLRLEDLDFPSNQDTDAPLEAGVATVPMEPEHVRDMIRAEIMSLESNAKRFKLDTSRSGTANDAHSSLSDLNSLTRPLASAVPIHKPRYARPLTPGEIRNMIAEEIMQAYAQVLNNGTPQTKKGLSKRDAADLAYSPGTLAYAKTPHSPSAKTPHSPSAKSPKSRPVTSLLEGSGEWESIEAAEGQFARHSAAKHFMTRQQTQRWFGQHNTAEDVDEERQMQLASIAAMDHAVALRDARNQNSELGSKAKHESELSLEQEHRLRGLHALKSGTVFLGISHTDEDDQEAVNRLEKVMHTAHDHWDKIRNHAFDGTLKELDAQGDEREYQKIRRERVYRPLSQEDRYKDFDNAFDRRGSTKVHMVSDRVPKNKAEHDTLMIEGSQRFRDKYFRKGPQRLLDCCEYSLAFKLGSLSFSGFSRESLIRRVCFFLHTNGFCQLCFLICTTIQAAFVVIQPSLVLPVPPASDQDGESRVKIFERIRQNLLLWYIYVDPVASFLLLVEVIVGSIGLGFWFREKPVGTDPRRLERTQQHNQNLYMRVSGYHTIDLFVLLMTGMEYLLSALWHTAGLMFKPFRLLRIFKPLTRLRAFWGIRTIITTLQQGSAQLFTVFAMLLFFMCAFSMFGMAIYGKSFRRYCVMTDFPTDPCLSDFSTGWAETCNMSAGARKEPLMYPGGANVVQGGYPFDKGCKIIANYTLGQYDKVYPLDRTKGRYHTCGLEAFRRNESVYETCEELENPQYGFSHFDNIAGALLTMTMASSGDAYNDVLWRALETEPGLKGVTLIFFFVVTAFNTFLLLGIFIAVVTGVFARIREEHGTAFRVVKAKSVTELPRFVNVMMKALEAVKLRKAKEQEPVLKKNYVQEWAHKLYHAPAFFYFAQLVIVLQALALASDQHDSTKEWKEFVFYGYWICTMFFACETVLRFLAAGSLHNFWNSNLARSELVLVTCGIAGLSSQSNFLMRVPALRLYRFMFNVQTLHAMLHSAATSAESIINLSVFIIVVALCFSIAGRYIFRNDMDEITRSNFGSLNKALLTTYQILTGDGWTQVYYDAMSTKTSTYGQFFAACYIISWFIFSALIIFNLFVAVIIENFQVRETIENINKPGTISLVAKHCRSAYSSMFRKLTEDRTTVAAETSGAGLVAADVVAEDMFHGPNPMGYLQRKNSFKSSTAEVLRKSLVTDDGVPIPPAHALQVVKTAKRVLYCLDEDNVFRRLMTWIKHHFLFDLIMFLAIFGSCVYMIIAPAAYDIPGQELLLSEAMTKVGERLFTIIFAVECIVRVVSDGFIYTETAYLKNPWNALDFIVLLFSIVDISGALSGAKVAYVVRLSKTLRPLRLMKRNERMRRVIDALISTLPPVFYVIIFSVFTFIIFALMGMGLFGGKFKDCSTPGAEYPAGKLECMGLYVYDDGHLNGVMVQRVWAVDFYNFDSMYKAALVLFRVQTMNYVPVLERALDVTEIDQSTKKDNSPWMALFMILYLTIAALFVMNLFMGFIVDGFNANKGSSQADHMYTRFIRQVQTYKPTYPRFKPPINTLSVSARKLVSTKYFRGFSILCVAINSVFMLVDHTDGTDDFRRMMDIQNLVFMVVLAVEVVFNAIGWGAGGFLDDWWKGLDLAVCVGTGTGYILRSERISQFAKSFRLLRIMYLMKMIKPIRVILETLLSCIMQLANILLILMLIYSMFAVAAIQIFGTTRYGERYGPTAKFTDFGSAMLTIAQIVTGDDWQYMLQDLSVEEPACTKRFWKNAPGYEGPDLSFGDCGSKFAPIYFIMLKIVCEYMLLNLFVGMILDNFGYITEDVSAEESSNWQNGSSSEQIQEMAKVFKKYDGGTGTMAVSSLPSFMTNLPQPLGFRRRDGSVCFRAIERSQMLMVRAELNVILRKAYIDKTKRMKGWFWWFDVFQAVFDHKRVLQNGVTFEEVLHTLLYWRTPFMVPDTVKIKRRARIEEVGLVAYALVGMEFFRKLQSKRVHNRTLKALRKRMEFREWSLHDQPRRRRSLDIRENRARDIQTADEMQTTVPHLLIRTLRTKIIDLKAVWYNTGEVVPHVKAVFDVVQKYPKPYHGIEVFKARARTDLVILKYLDPREGAEVHVVADFTGVQWEGWSLRNNKEDSFWKPVMLDPSPNMARRWLQIDFHVKTFRAKSKTRPVGSLLDVQSIMVDSMERMKMGDGISSYEVVPHKMRQYNTSMNIVRLNVGTLYGQTMWPEEESMEEARSRMSKGLPKLVQLPPFFDSVMEVVGYIPTNDTQAHLKEMGQMSGIPLRDIRDLLQDENVYAEHIIYREPETPIPSRQQTPNPLLNPALHALHDINHIRNRRREVLEARSQHDIMVSPSMRQAGPASMIPSRGSGYSGISGDLDTPSHKDGMVTPQFRRASTMMLPSRGSGYSGISGDLDTPSRLAFDFSPDVRRPLQDFSPDAKRRFDLDPSAPQTPPVSLAGDRQGLGLELYNVRRGSSMKNALAVVAEVSQDDGGMPDSSQASPIH